MYSFGLRMTDFLFFFYVSIWSQYFCGNLASAAKCGFRQSAWNFEMVPLFGISQITFVNHYQRISLPSVIFTGTVPPSLSFHHQRCLLLPNNAQSSVQLTSGRCAIPGC
ncbi:hypothetical protein BX666DRAFT_1277662 [Dichotomocladium elegans]|nr:hypothetical protein BX666DRAFT_1277662 [Dichotomocladium elegans]